MDPLEKIRKKLRSQPQASSFFEPEEKSVDEIAEDLKENLFSDIFEDDNKKTSLLPKIEKKEEIDVLEDLDFPTLYVEDSISPPAQQQKRNIEISKSAVEKEDNSQTQVDQQIPSPPISELTYAFFPKEDISVYDLCRILALTRFMITEDIYQQFPIELKKYFVRVEDGYVDKSSI